MKPVKDARYKNRTRWVRANDDEIVFTENGTVDVFAWGYIFQNCEVHVSTSDRFEEEKSYVVVEHPTGNKLKVWW